MEHLSLAVKRVFHGVASIQDQIALAVNRDSKVESIITIAAERRFPALYCLIRTSTGERLDEKKLIKDYSFASGELLELRRVRRVQNVGAFFPDALAPAGDVHTRPDITKSMLVDETVPVTKVIGDLAAKMDMGREGELLGLFPVPAHPALSWHGLDPDATLRELDPHAAVTLVLRPILLRTQKPPTALLREYMAARALLSTALRHKGAAPVPIALHLGTAPAAALARLLEHLLACKPEVQREPQLALPEWMHALVADRMATEGGDSARNKYQLVRSVAEASGERASRFETLVKYQDAARRLFLLANARTSCRLASMHSDLLVCLFRQVCGASEETNKLVRWVLSNGEALRRRLWSHVHHRHTSLAKRDHSDT